MAHNLRLKRSTTLFGGTVLNNIDLDNDGGSSKYRVVAYIRGEQRFKETFAENPLIEGRQLVAYQMEDVEEEIHLVIDATSIDDLLLQLSKLDQFQIWTRDAQVALNASGTTPFYCWLSDRPLGTSTKTFNYHIKSLSVIRPKGLYDVDMLASQAGSEDDPVILRLTRAPYVSASTLTILNAVAANNGAGNYVDIAASGATAITGDQTSPLAVKVVCASTLTKRLLLGLRTRGTPSNFKHAYWAKDATLTSNTVALTGKYTVTNAVLTSNVATLTIGTHSFASGDIANMSGVSLSAVFNGTYTLSGVTATTISYARTNANIGSAASSGTVQGGLDGDGAGNGTRTTAADTSENKTHRWVNSTNTRDQYGRHRVYGRFRSNTASRYSVRLKAGLTDGTNDLFPADENGGFLTDTAQAVGTHSGNAFALVYLGELMLPAVESFGAAVAQLLFELHTTCSNTSGAPTLDFDGFRLMPLDDGPFQMGFVQATFDFALGATGVSSAIVSAIPGDVEATLANGSDVPTFPKFPDIGKPLWGTPETAARLFLLAVDSDNARHDYTLALTVTVWHELRHAAGIGA